MNILITSAGRRGSLVKAFKAEVIRFFPDAKIFTADMQPELSSACRLSDKFFRVPPVKDPLYSSVLFEICESNDIGLIVPTIDTELITLSEHAGEFLRNGIIPVISDIETVLMCRDKRKTNKYFDSIGFPYCKEIEYGDNKFPVFAKPSDGSSSIGIQIVYNKAQLEILSQNEKMMFVEYLDPESYCEYTVDMYFDRNHYLKCAVPRERIEVRTGEVSKSVTRRNELYDIVCSTFAFCKGFAGCITLQIFKNRNNNEIYGIEINPRFGGGYPLSYKAGANFPEMLIREYLCGEEITFSGDWKEDTLMLRYDEEVIVNDFKG